MRTEALLTSMDAPLGRAVGNANEVIESIETLKGKGPADLESLSVRLAARMLVLAGIAKDDADAERRVRTALASGAGRREVPRDHRRAGRRSRVSTTTVGCRGRHREPWLAPRAGFVGRMDAELVGRAAVALGAGRDRADAAVDPAVGIDIVAPVGAKVQAKRSGAHDLLCDTRSGRRRPRAARSRDRDRGRAAGVAPAVIGTVK